MVAVFAEVRRVLKPSGTCWLNLGDSYAGSGMTGGTLSKEGSPGRVARMFHGNRRDTVPGLAQKQLFGIPWRVAFALQADGWYLRSDIIWSKPNPMPESVTDRPTKSHEYLFLLTKSAKYFFDADAVREPHAEMERPQSEKRRLQRMGREVAVVAGGGQSSKGIDGGLVEATHTMATNPAGRNIRSVWNIATRPYPGAHFAVFPPELPERCIKAGSPELGVILDPFAGSGTVGLVANRLSRRAILIDLNPEYLKQQMKRNAQTPLGLGAA
jgi:DNA modification methylase